jgi:hypothetical protein
MLQEPHSEQPEVVSLQVLQEIEEEYCQSESSSEEGFSQIVEGCKPSIIPHCLPSSNWKSPVLFFVWKGTSSFVYLRKWRSSQSLGEFHKLVF